MQFLQVFKRVVPFALALSAGILIASIFIPVSAPEIKFEKKRWSGRHDCRSIRREKREMRDEMLKLRMELEQARRELAEAESERARKVMTMKTVRVAPDAPVKFSGDIHR